MNKEQKMRFVWDVMNCYLQDTKSKKYICKTAIRTCTSALPDPILQIYIQFLNHADVICFIHESKVFSWIDFYHPLALATKDGALNKQARREYGGHGSQDVTFCYFLSLIQWFFPLESADASFRSELPSSAAGRVSETRRGAAEQGFGHQIGSRIVLRLPRFWFVWPADRSAPVLLAHAQRHAFRLWEHRPCLRISAIPIFGPWFVPIDSFLAAQHRVVLDADLSVGSADLPPHGHSGSADHRGE